MIMTLVYLVLVRYTGFTRDIGALGDFVRKAGTTFQGR
jgi:hypothetical protein